MTQLPPAIQLTERFTQAVDYARVQHAQQTRKGTTIPYLYHLLGVASLVLRWGGDEDQAIAGLLHDVVEDCGAAHLGVVRERFGDRIAGIVGAIDVLADNPLIGRELEHGKRELVIGRGAHGYVALYRYVEAMDAVVILAIRAQREAGYTR